MKINQNSWHFFNERKIEKRKNLKSQKNWDICYKNKAIYYYVTIFLRIRNFATKIM